MARLPKSPHRQLNNTCLVNTGEEVGYCYIRFSETFVDFVGKKLPRGVADFDPAYIEVVRAGGKWEIRATYYLDGVTKVLWKTADMPSWIGKLKKGKHDASTSAQSTDSGKARGYKQGKTASKAQAAAGAAGA